MLHEVSVKYPACAFEVNPQNHTGIFFFSNFAEISTPVAYFVNA